MTKIKNKLIPRPWCVSVLIEKGKFVEMYTYTGIRIICDRSKFLNLEKYKKSVVKSRLLREQKAKKLKQQNGKNNTGSRPQHSQKRSSSFFKGQRST